MRELILAKLKSWIKDGDEEITEEFGSFRVISKLDDAELLKVYDFAVGFRG